MAVAMTTRCLWGNNGGVETALATVFQMSWTDCGAVGIELGTTSESKPSRIALLKVRLGS